jgi:hypothetical protein
MWSRIFRIVFFSILAITSAIITPINIINGAATWLIVINFVAVISCSLSVVFAVLEIVEINKRRKEYAQSIHV